MSSAATQTALTTARQLEPPTRDETLRRDATVYRFWDGHERLLERAWAEWNRTECGGLPKLGGPRIAGGFRRAVGAAWRDPSAATEGAVRALWEEVAPGVFAAPFFDLDEVHKLQEWFSAAAGAGIPVRQPYGITLNRRGMMTDSRSVGYFAAPAFQKFYRMLVNDYVRPLGRLFFQDDVITPADDDTSFAFSIEYQGTSGGDKAIRPHSDASTVTFNINLDRHKTWTGSDLTFFTRKGEHHVEWKPGYAIMHLGKSMHAARPIESGTRANWVIWTMSSTKQHAYGDTPRKGAAGNNNLEQEMSPKQRWTKSSGPGRKLSKSERWSPF